MSLKRLVKEALDNNSSDIPVFKLKSITWIWILSIFAVGISEYIIIKNNYDDYIKEFHVIGLYAKRITEITRIESVLTDFMTFKHDSSIMASYADLNIEDRRQEIRSSVTSIITKTAELESSTYFPYISKYTGDPKSLTIYSNQSSTVITVEEKEALILLTARAYNLSMLVIEDAHITNPDIRTVLFNYFNVITPSLLQTALNIKSDMNDSLKNFELSILIIFIANGILALICSVWGMLLLMEIGQQKESVLYLFLEIPLSNVELISKKRDKFIEFFDNVMRHEEATANNPNNNNPESSDSDLSFGENKRNNHKGVFDDSLKDGSLNVKNREDEETQLKNRKKMIEKHKQNRLQKAKNGLLNSIILIVISVLYSIAVTTLQTSEKKNLNQYLNQFYLNEYYSNIVLDSLNKNRLMRIESSFPIQNKDIAESALDSLIVLDGLGQELDDFFLFIIEQNNQFETDFTKLYFGDACSFLPEDVENCRVTLGSSLKMGLINLKEQIFKNLRMKYDEFLALPTTPSSTDLELLSFNDKFKKYPMKIIEIFNNYEESYLKSTLDSATSILQILMIIYLFVLMVANLFFWLPKLSKLRSEVWRTTRMIHMIPLDVVNNIKDIRFFLKGLIGR